MLTTTTRLPGSSQATLVATKISISIVLWSTCAIGIEDAYKGMAFSLSQQRIRTFPGSPLDEYRIASNGYAEENAKTLTQLVSRYQSTQRPITVSFRRMIASSRCYHRTLHFIHPYPGKLLFQIPFFFICNKSLSVPGSLIADPFCGSGTVLLEALFASRNSVGLDSNPLARLISKVKTTAIDIVGLESMMPAIIKQCRRTDPGHPPDVVNLTYWFHPHAIHQLSQINRTIRGIHCREYKDFLSVCFSACVRKVSLADPRVSVPVRLKAERYPDGHKLRGITRTHLKHLQAADCIEIFERTVYENMQRLAALESFVPMQNRARIVGADARQPDGIPRNSVDLVVTSPPYMSAQKYIRSSSLELGWLGLARSSELKMLERRCLGREHFHKAEYQQVKKTGIPQADTLIREIYKINPLRSCLAANYLNGMRFCPH